jgi:hypothetical protein
MRTIDAIASLLDQKMARGLIKTRNDINLNRDIALLFGEPKQYIDSFNERFEGKATPELIDLLVRAGKEALLTEAVSIRVKMSEASCDFSTLVRSSIFGNGNLRRAVVIERILLSEKLFCVESSLREIESLEGEALAFLKG